MAFGSGRQHLVTLHHAGDRWLVLAKGAVERVVGLCSSETALDGSTGPWDNRAVLRAAEALAVDGLRVLATAVGENARGQPLGEDRLGTLTLTGPRRDGRPAASRGPVEEPTLATPGDPPPPQPAASSEKAATATRDTTADGLRRPMRRSSFLPGAGNRRPSRRGPGRPAAHAPDGRGNGQGREREEAPLSIHWKGQYRLAGW